MLVHRIMEYRLARQAPPLMDGSEENAKALAENEPLVEIMAKITRAQRETLG